MKKKIVKFSVLPVGAAFIFFSFSTKHAVEKNELSREEKTVTELHVCYTALGEPEFFIENPGSRMYPKLGNSYIAFKEAIGFAESSGKYNAVNDFGYLGKYQFGRGTLEMIGIENTNLFLNAPKLQEAAFYANASRNKWILKRDIARFKDEIINGVKITESGILAAAHLAGPGNVKKYLRSGGNNSFSDGFGTSIRYYFKEFAGYDTSFVKPNRLAQVSLES